ncbi:hypothetical protein ETB97_000644 [Aspergillus alliaceus]|uniref:Uncharacterized protein n=1 Tax=Petromyces alliaceus TaxID=209559 RepID=A0A8H6AFE4_PETAA|nr:hypothetical protein ETB97_000644 [Aspergillus burnettii]
MFHSIGDQVDHISIDAPDKATSEIGMFALMAVPSKLFVMGKVLAPIVTTNAGTTGIAPVDEAELAEESERKMQGSILPFATSTRHPHPHPCYQA